MLFLTRLNFSILRRTYKNIQKLYTAPLMNETAKFCLCIVEVLECFFYYLGLTLSYFFFVIHLYSA